MCARVSIIVLTCVCAGLYVPLPHTRTARSVHADLHESTLTLVQGPSASAVAAVVIVLPCPAGGVDHRCRGVGQLIVCIAIRSVLAVMCTFAPPRPRVSGTTTCCFQSRKAIGPRLPYVRACVRNHTLLVLYTADGDITCTHNDPCVLAYIRRIAVIPTRESG